ncbi:MAG: hypothetical protein WKH64_01205 [Chloroflexia bacterium]
MNKDRPTSPANTGQRLTTRRMSRRQERERRRQRLAVMIIGGIVLFTVLLVLVPFLKRSLWDPRQTVASVGSETLTRAEFDKIQRLAALQLQDPSALGQVFDQWQQNRQTIRTGIQDAIAQANLADVPIEASALDPIVDDLVLLQTTWGANATAQDIQRGMQRAIAPALANDAPAGAAATTPTAPSAPAAPTAQPTTGASAQQTPAATATLPPLPDDQVREFFGMLEDTTVYLAPTMSNWSCGPLLPDKSTSSRTRRRPLRRCIRVTYL